MKTKLVYDVIYTFILIVVASAAFQGEAVALLNTFAYCLVWVAIILAAAVMAFSVGVATYDKPNLVAHCREVVANDDSPAIDAVKVVLMVLAILANGWYGTALVYAIMEINAFVMLWAARRYIARTDAGMKA